jgi:cytochrome c-type biogenesis protein CcmH/NrfG
VHKNPVITLIVGALLGFFIGFVVGQRQPAAPPPAQASGQMPVNPHGAGGSVPAEGQATGASQPASQPKFDPKLGDELMAVKQLLAKDPTNYAHLVQAGNLCYDMNLFQEAIEYYEKARGVKDDSADVQTDLGNCYREAGQAGKALELFDKAASLRPDHWQSRYNAVVVRLFDLADPAGAKQELEKLKAVKPVPAGMPDVASLEQEIAKRLK